MNKRSQYLNQTTPRIQPCMSLTPPTRRAFLRQSVLAAAAAAVAPAFASIKADSSPRVPASAAGRNAAPQAGRILSAGIGGYRFVPHSREPESFNAGFSLYSAAWPLIAKYPGHRFQSGLFGTWLSRQYDGAPPAHLYSDIEGGLGWWTDTRFPTETPKFIMGGVGPNFSEIANGPAHGAGDWDHPRGLYGVAQLSPWLLFPIDGLNLRQGTCGQLFGYGYFALPLTPAKATTDGANVPTGDHSWTLFLSTKNFKGPVAFFTPYFWSHATVNKPQWAGKLLDSRPGQPNKPIQMETAFVPAAVFQGTKGESYLRTASVLFPIDADGNSVLVHRSTVYNKSALWNDVQKWFDGGPEVSGSIHPQSAVVQKVHDGGAGWHYWPPNRGAQQVPLILNALTTPFSPDPLTFGYRWNYELTRITTADGSLVKLPDYFHLTTNAKHKPEWTPVSRNDLPALANLASVNFDHPSQPAPRAYTTPDDPNSCWKKPGPVAGPFKAQLGDGSVVTYYWYRFADQPALLNAGLTDDERAQLQTRVEKIHRSWPKDRNYFAPPTIGTLCDLDPALLVTPPKGMEVGYVPIATRQERTSQHR